jgi:hypothetical protein
MQYDNDSRDRRHNSPGQIPETKTPEIMDEAMEELAEMLWDDEEEPTFHEEFLYDYDLDFSVDSVKILTDYLDEVKKLNPSEDELDILILRAGSYLGEVIRKSSKIVWHWYEDETADYFNPGFDDIPWSLGVSSVMVHEPSGTMIYPILQVENYLTTGMEINLRAYVLLHQVAK